MWWVVWVSTTDNEFHHCKGFDESSAHKTASLLVETYGIRRADNHSLIDSFKCLAQTVQDGVEIYRDTEVSNPFHFAVQAWVFQRASYKKAVKAAKQAWASMQIGGPVNGS